MPTLRTIVKDLRKEMACYLYPFPPVTSQVSFKLMSCIFAKTRFVSHIHFIGRCLNSQVVPKGFRVNFHPSNFGLDGSRYFSDISAASNSFSRTLMRSTIRAMCTKRDSLSAEMLRHRHDLSNACPPVLVSSITAKIRALNSTLYKFLQETKSAKFASLVDTSGHTNDSHSNAPVSDRAVVTIPDDLPISDAEKSLLSKGLNFVPISKKSDEFDAKRDSELFFRRIRLKAFFSDNNSSQQTVKDPFESLSQRKSVWTPPENQFASVDLFVDKCRNDVNKINFDKTLRFSNLPNEEWSALHSLRSRSDIVIKPADKGGALVVWRADLYKEEALRQLSDVNFYQEIDCDQTSANQKKVKDTVKNLISSGDLPPTAQNLIVTTPRTSKIYFLPKIHKPNNPGRPIVSACSCPTELISSYLDSLMRPIVENLPTFIKDTNHALKIFENFRFPSDTKFLFTMDVKSLYTVIPNDEGLRALKHFFDRRSDLAPSTSTLLRLAELVLNLNCFSFGDQFYQQVNGVAMGTKMGPNYANLFVGFIEEQIFSQYSGPIPELFKRFIDDCIGATSLERAQLESFIDFVNNFHPALEFTWEISTESVSFLDILASIQDNQIQTSAYYKPTDSHNYLLYSSSHPQHTLNSIPFSQFLRLRRLCSDDRDFESKCEEMRSFFVHRGYPQSLISAALAKVSNISRASALTPKTATSSNRVPFAYTFHPTNNPLKSIVRRNFNLLESDTRTAQIFDEPPLFSCKRARNLRSFLVKSTLPSDKEPGTFRCGRSRCNTCAFICSQTSVSGPKSSHKITDHFTCLSTNVIYCIRCKLCNQLYVGETGRRLGDRIREHLNDIRNNSASKPVSRHFNSANHSIQHFSLFGLCLVTGDNDNRKYKEMRLIHSLGTLQPSGMNERFSFI